MFLFRWVRRLLFLAILIAVGLYFTRHFLLRTALEWGVWYHTGFTLKVEKADFSDVNPPKLSVTGLRLENPPGYNQRLAASASLLELIFPLDQQGGAWPPRIDRLRLNLDEVVLEKSREGDLNLLDLKGAKNALALFSTPESGTPWIGEVVLSVQRIRYYDYTKQKGLLTPEPETLNVAANQLRFKNIIDERQLEAVLLRTVLDLARKHSPQLRENTGAIPTGMPGATGGGVLTPAVPALNPMPASPATPAPMKPKAVKKDVKPATAP